MTMASAVSRMPEIKAHIGASATELAFALVCVGIGSIVAMPFAGRLTTRFGTGLITGIFTTIACTGWSLIPLANSVPELAAILFLTGMGVGTWDVAMNVQGSIVERSRHQVLMPLWHGLFSVGGVIGALIGAGAAHAGIPLAWHIPVVAGVLGGVVIAACGWFLPSSAGYDELPAGEPAPGDGRSGDSGLAPYYGASPEDDASAQGGSGAAGRRPDAAHRRRDPAGRPRDPAGRRSDGRAKHGRGVTGLEILLGLIMLSTALGEGAANDWLAVALVDGRGAPAAIGALTYAGFNLTMAIGRFSGGPLIARFGRVASLRAAGAIAATGVLLLSLVPGTGVALGGAALWGLGLAIVFPSAVSAAGEVPGRADRAIATVSTIGYGGFLFGAPMIGTLAHLVPLLDALLVVAAFALLIVCIAPAAREHRAATRRIARS
jgi:MFS family permease